MEIAYFLPHNAMLARYVLWPRLRPSVSILSKRLNNMAIAETIEMPFGGNSGEFKEPLLDGVHIPKGKGQFWGLSGPVKKHGSLWRELC